ncbi:MAG: hypothetical protein B6D64_09235 [Bacteroidetes bacterium 4484_276]|nr:MAG: hypothetical protein B6D64_09235 [Bacteroidetes bacterium 4484_276]
MNDILTYNDSVLDEMINDSSASFFERFTGSTEDKSITITLHTDASKIESMRRIFDDYTLFQNKKDDFCIKAIQNLIIKNNFLELSLELSEDQITEDDYTKEIENNPHKYIIDIEYVQDPNDIRVINEIVKKIGLEFSVDEVAEIFSLDSLDLENKVAQIK